MDDPGIKATVQQIADSLGEELHSMCNVLRRLRKRSLLARKKEALGRSRKLGGRQKHIWVYFIHTEPIRGKTSMLDRAMAMLDYHGRD